MEYFVVVGAEEVGSWKKKKKGRRGRCEEEEGNKRIKERKGICPERGMEENTSRYIRF